MEKIYDVYITELVTYKVTVEASCKEDALDIAQSDYGHQDAVSCEYYSDDICELQQKIEKK